MKNALSSNWLFLIPIGLLFLFHLWTLRTVPFHPDESTYIYMSADFQALFNRPDELIYDPNKSDDLRQHYRLIDAPVARYLIGFARTIAGIRPQASDWDWAKTWEENDRAGARPDPHLLLTARLASTLLLPLSLLWIYMSGTSIGGPLSGLFAALFLGTSALVLLHARRAMAEGALIFGITFFLWSLSQADKRPWLTGLAMALAFNAKQSALALFPAGLLAVCWIAASHKNVAASVLREAAAPTERKGFRQQRLLPGTRAPLAAKFVQRIGLNLAQYLGVFFLVTFALNPVFWKDPARSVQAAVDERQDLVQRQVADIRRLAPEMVLDAPGERAVAILANLYITPPMFYEIGNYINETRTSESSYLSIPGHNLFRGFIGGGILLLLTILGVVSTAIKLREKEPDQQRAIVLLMLGTLLQLAGLLLAVPLPWQRYSLPLVPFVALWNGFGLSWIVSPIRLKLPKLQKQANP